MKLALLGADRESLALASAAIAGGHEVSWQGDLADAPRDQHAWLTDADQGERWEDLFDPAVADAVIVGRGAANQDLRARQVLELVKLGRPLLAVHPLFDSVLTYFEVDLARGESGAVLEHFNPLAESAVAGALEHWVSESHPALGDVEQVTVTRTLVDRSHSNVLWHFARDVELLDGIAGPLDQLGAHAAGRAREGDAAIGQADYSALSVQLSGPRPIPVRWAVEPLTTQPELRLTLICEHGRIHASFAEDARSVTLTQQETGGEPTTLDAGAYDAAPAAIERFAAQVAAATGATTWPVALRSMELVDTIEIALRRGRMIDVHRQQLTEQLAFKGTMAAAGCAVIGAVVPATLAVGWIAGQLGLPVARFLPHVLLAFLGGFLALQLLPRLLARKRSDASD